MNDSFLEDLELVPADPKQTVAYPANRHVTTRTATSSPLPNLSERKLENLVKKKAEYSPLTGKHSGAKESAGKDSRKSLESDPRSCDRQSKSKVIERKEKPIENKLKPIENRVRNDNREHDEIKKKIRDIKAKVPEVKTIGKDRRSGSYKENSCSSDISTKENSHPSDSTKESTSQLEVCKERGRKSDCSKKSEIKENDPVVLLNAIKNLISMYTKQESNKILRTMQEFHMITQASLIKNLILQSDDINNMIHPSKDSIRMRTLVEQNGRLQEDIYILKKKNEDLQKKLEEFELLKQENITLKLKCKELSKQ